MSEKERKRLSILPQHLGGRLTADEAAAELEISVRQLYRIKARFVAEGDAGLLHRARGRPSNFGFPPRIKQEVLALYRRKYADYGPTLFAERMERNEGYCIDHETLRRWLHRASLLPLVRRGHKHRKKRPRQPHIGSLVQLDGSEHAWFEGRGPTCTLLVFIDDASNTVFMRFARSENTQEVLEALRDYVARFGIPAAVYVDRGSVFYHLSKTTDFVRVCQTLGIRIIYANSAQAKGRVERANRTQQDRLIKIMREHGIRSIDAANLFLEAEYLAEHNARFAMPEGLEDIHRSAEHYDLQNIFCFEFYRCVRHDMTIQFRAKTLQILSSSGPLPLPKQYITLRKWLDGSLHLFWREQEVRWQCASMRETRQQPRVLGKAETFTHPWYNKPVGKLKRNRPTTRGRK